MKRHHIIFAVSVATLLMSAVARADDNDVIAYRKHIMRTLDAQAAALGLILSNKIPDANGVAHLEAVALTGRIALKAFEAKVLGDGASPEIWADWPDFSKRMNEFAQKADKAALFARENDTNAAYGKILDALTCKNCHYTYRIER